MLSRMGSAFRFGYDAVKARGKRRAPDGILQDEDAENKPDDRKKLLSAARDQQRNFSVARWMVQRHLDYVSTFTFQARTGDKGNDRTLETLMTDWGQRRSCEVTRRHRLSRLVRALECRRILDGDVLLMRIADGRVQAIEGDRIRTPNSGLPNNIKASDLKHGVKLDKYGAAEAYAVCNREGSSFKFERMIPEYNVFHHGYYDRLDQVRGISPLAAAINTLQDTYEALDHAVNKVKVEQYFALLLLRNGAETVGEVVTDEDGDQKIRFGKNPAVLNFNTGEDAKFLTSNSPSSATQAFFQVLIQVALKALDIPYSFYSEDFTNYSGARQALLQYEQSADIKREDNIELLDWITAWKIRTWIDEGLLPESVGIHPWEWIPSGLPWIDPLKEITAQKEAIALRTTSRTRLCREAGIAFRDLIDEIAEEEDYMREKNVLFETPKVDPSITALLLAEDKGQKHANQQAA